MGYRELFLDTTYVMPFFGFDITVKGFSRSLYRGVIDSVEQVHLSEVSIIEAKAKSLRMGGRKPELDDKFNEGLSVLSQDEKVVIHGFREIADKKFNVLRSLGLGFFDTLILAQSCAVGVLLTEDSKLLRVKDPGVNIISWKTLVGEMKGADG